MARIKSRYTEDEFVSSVIRDEFDRGYKAAREEADDTHDEEEGEPLPPSPDDVALAFMQALMTALPADADLEPVVARAWGAVPSFYIWRQRYAQQIAPMFFNSAQPG